MKESKISEWMISHRRLVVTLLILAFLSLLVVRIFVFPTLDAAGNIDWTAMITSSLDGLISTIVISFVVAVTLWWTKPPTDRIPPGFEVLPTSISKQLEHEATLTDQWEYLGHTGRYVRNRIFPILEKHAQKQNQRIHIRMVILDPRNDELCDQYAKYRNRSRSSEIFQDHWSKQKVKEELIATVARCIILDQEENQVRCEIRFRSFLSQFRLDVSRDQIMVTQEDPQEPAFSYPRGSRFFDYYKRENQLIWDHASPLPQSITASNYNQCMNMLAEQLASFLGGSDSAKVADRALELLQSDRSPYA